MSRTIPVLMLFAISGLVASADPPALPPPEKAKLPSLPPPEPAAKAPITLVSVELCITAADLEKHVLAALVHKVDPKADPVLPFVVKGNERDFALGADNGPPDAPKPAGDGQAQEKAPPARPMLIPRQPGAHPRLDRLAARPLVAGMVDRLMATMDLTYRIEIRSFKLTPMGNTITCEIGGGFHCEGKAPPPGPPAPVNVRDIGVKLMLTKNLEWSENGKLELKEGSTKIWIDPDAPLVGFPRLDIERVLRLNGLLASAGGVIDRELMKQFSGDNLPDLNVLAPELGKTMPFLAVAELTAYPIRGDDKNVYFPFEVGLIGAKKKTSDPVKIATRPGPAPEPKVRGRLVPAKDGKLDLKFGPRPQEQPRGE